MMKHKTTRMSKDRPKAVNAASITVLGIVEDRCRNPNLVRADVVALVVAVITGVRMPWVPVI